jgi:adenine-specific DNA-methyltransferase
MDQFQLHLGDCVEVMKVMPDNCIDLILTDPPYFKVKGEPWDNQWGKPQQFLAWLDTVLEQFQRILKPNGSLYLFASPQMAARVEAQISERFNVLNSIRWHKATGWHKKQRKEDLRQYLAPWEAVIFAEQKGSDLLALGEDSSWQPFIYELLRAYLDGERIRAELSVQDVAEAWRIKTGAANRTGMAGHWFSMVQWRMPTEENYNWLRTVFNAGGGSYLERQFSDVAAEMAVLQEEFSQVRRPMFLSADVAHTDLWTFDAVKAYAGKHPCEKPAAMLEHIITASSRPGAVVFDAFSGSGSTAITALKLGRRFIGAELSEQHHAEAMKRILESTMPTPQADLFAA